MGDIQDPVGLFAKNLDDIAKGNDEFVGTFKDGDKPMPPGRKIAIVTCMDARLHPEKFLGLNIGDAHVIRNAGGRVSPDALRSLVISQQLLGTTGIVVIEHTDCGMLTFDNPAIVKVINGSLGEEAAVEAGEIDFLPFSSLEDTVKKDVQLIKDSRLIPAGIPISGKIYDVKTGKLIDVV